MVDFEEIVMGEIAKNLANLTHDLRAISGKIYNAAELLKTNIGKGLYDHAMTQSDTVIASQQMLSLRLDMLDYSTGLSLQQDPERVPVYKKYDKTVKCFQANTKEKEIDLTINGPSQGYTYGAPILELIPFAIIENAVKYCPKGSFVQVKVTDFDERIDAHVVSMGPKITRAEQERLFEQGFRAEAARKTGKSGSGIGLSAANDLMKNSFGGKMSVFQETVGGSVGGIDCYRTIFTCSFKIFFGEDF